MLSSNNQSELTRKQNAVKTFSLKKLTIGLVSMAVGSFVFLGQSNSVFAEEVVEEQVPVVEVMEEIDDEEPVSDEQVFDEPVSDDSVSENNTAEDTVVDEVVTPKEDVIEKEVDEEPVEETDSETETGSEVGPALKQARSNQVDDGIELSDDTLYITEEKRIDFSVGFDEPVNVNEIALTLGGKALSEWRSFNFDTSKFDGDSWIRVENLVAEGNRVFGTIVNDYPYGMDATDLRPFPRWNFEELMGTYELAVHHTTSDERKTIALTIGNYEGFHTHDELKPAIDEILDLASEKDDRYFFYESLGQSYEGRDLHFVTIAKDDQTMDRYLNETLKMAHENPEVLQLAIENGEFENYQVPIFINNIHPDESPGVDAQIELLRRLATEDEITFTTNGVETSMNISELLDHFILLFSITMNPDGKYYNSRENSNKMDINRDNAFQTQIETQIMAETVAKYNPIAFLDLHGFVNPLLIEPTTPPHEPNFEYDLLMGGIRDAETNMPIDASAPGAINHAIAMGEAAIGNTGLEDYMIPLLEWADGWDDAGLGYTAVFTLLGGTLGHTIEIPKQNRESMLAAVYAMIGSFDYLSKNKDQLYWNQLEVFRRSINNEDNRNVDSWLVNSDLEVVGRPRGEYENYFPDYYIIPLDRMNQQNLLEANNMVEYFLRNGVNVYTTDQAIEYNGVTYAPGSVVIPLTQVRRGLINAALSVGNDESNWGGMYAELVLNFPALRGFDSVAVRDLEINKDTLTQVIEAMDLVAEDVVVETTLAVLRSSNNDALRLVNELLNKGVKVSIVQKRAGNANPGDYVVDTNDLTDNLANYFVEYEGLESDLVVKEIVKPAIYVAPPQNNYANLTTSTIFVLKELGFTIVDDINEANLIIDAAGTLSADEIGDLPYIALGSSALRSVNKNGLYDLDLRFDRGSHEGLLHAEYDQDSVISGMYDKESVAYVASGSVLGEPRDEASVFLRVADREDFYIEGWWPDHENIAAGGILGFSDVVDGQTMTFLASDVTNKAHTKYLYRLLANAIYSSLSSEETVAEREMIPEDIHNIIFVDGDEQITVEVKDGDTVTPPTITRKGYKLLGWRVMGESELFDFATPITEPLIFIAEWQAIGEDVTPDVPGTDDEAQETIDDAVHETDTDSEETTTQGDTVEVVAVSLERADEADAEEGERLPDTSTSAWFLGLIGATSLLTGAGIKRKED